MCTLINVVKCIIAINILLYFIAKLQILFSIFASHSNISIPWRLEMRVFSICAKTISKVIFAQHDMMCTLLLLSSKSYHNYNLALLKTLTVEPLGAPDIKSYTHTHTHTHTHTRPSTGYCQGKATKDFSAGCGHLVKMLISLDAWYI